MLYFKEDGLQSMLAVLIFFFDLSLPPLFLIHPLVFFALFSAYRLFKMGLLSWPFLSLSIHTCIELTYETYTCKPQNVQQLPPWPLRSTSQRPWVSCSEGTQAASPVERERILDPLSRARSALIIL